MRDPYFPFQALGLRANPFGALTAEDWAAVAVLPHGVAQAAAAGGHLQILGRMGRGKTTALLALASQARRAGLRAAYEYLPPGQTEFGTPLAGLHVLALDEAQRLRRAERQRLLRAAGHGLRLLLGSHISWRWRFARRGLTLRTARLDRPDREHLGALLERRLRYFLLDPERPSVWLAPAAVDLLHAAFGSDLRGVERCLYEVFQALPGPGEVAAEQVRPALSAAAPG